MSYTVTTALVFSISAPLLLLFVGVFIIFIFAWRIIRQLGTFVKRFPLFENEYQHVPAPTSINDNDKGNKPYSPISWTILEGHGHRFIKQIVQKEITKNFKVYEQISGAFHLDFSHSKKNNKFSRDDYVYGYGIIPEVKDSWLSGYGTSRMSASLEDVLHEWELIGCSSPQQREKLDTIRFKELVRKSYVLLEKAAAHKELQLQHSSEVICLSRYPWQTVRQYILALVQDYSIPEANLSLLLQILEKATYSQESISRLEFELFMKQLYYIIKVIDRSTNSLQTTNQSLIQPSILQEQ